MKKDYSSSKVKGFTLIELTVVMTILWILTLVWVGINNKLVEDQIKDDEKNNIMQLWNIFSTVIYKKWDVPLDSFCKKTDWTYSSGSCISNNFPSWECKWAFNDINNPNCTKWCIIINCVNNNCTGNKNYYDFEKLITQETDRTLDFKKIYKNLSYKICSLNQPNSDVTIWKWDLTEFNTFNPSFSLYHEWNLVYSYNSNP